MDDLRQRILGLVDVNKPVMRVTVPEWGHDVVIGIRRLSMREKLAFEGEHGAFEDIDRRKDAPGYWRWLVRYCIATATDESGVKLFHAEDEATLVQQAAIGIERLAIAALRVNHLSGEEVQALGNVSGEALNGASPSGSPAI